MTVVENPQQLRNELRSTPSMQSLIAKETQIASKVAAMAFNGSKHIYLNGDLVIQKQGGQDLTVSYRKTHGQQQTMFFPDENAVLNGTDPLYFLSKDSFPTGEFGTSSPFALFVVSGENGHKLTTVYSFCQGGETAVTTKNGAEAKTRRMDHEDILNANKALDAIKKAMETVLPKAF